MAFQIIRNDITRMKTDAIVNAANTALMPGGGVCGAIFCAAGYDELKRECMEIGHCDTGKAVITRGYNLAAKYIIHTPGPIYDADRDDNASLLYSCYKSSMELAKKHDLTSIAFPLISSGIYGYPADEALKVATKAISDFLNDNEMEVYLVVYNRDVFKESLRQFKTVFEYIDSHLVVEEDKAKRMTQLNAQKYPIYQGYSGTAQSTKRKKSRLPGLSGLMGKSKRRASDKEDKYKDTSIKEGSQIRREIHSEPETDIPVNIQFTMKPPSAQDEEPLKKKKLHFPKLSELRNKNKYLDLTQVIEDMDASFSETLLYLIDQSGMTDAQVYKKANIDRKLFSKIRSHPEYKPRKNTAIALAIALELDMGQMKDLVARAGYSFTHSSVSDIIIEYFVKNGNYDIFEINEVLFAFDQQLIGA